MEDGTKGTIQIAVEIRKIGSRIDVLTGVVVAFALLFFLCFLIVLLIPYSMR
jgi:hypothetical protein